MKDKIELSLIFVITWFLILSVVFAVVIINRNKTIHSKNEQIKDLNREIGEYQAMESIWEDYIYLIVDIYEVKINEAVLEERVKWLENKNSNYYDAKFVETLMDDVETFTEYLISYVKLNGTDNGFEEWLIKNDKPLYDKMMYYDDIYESRKK